MRAFPIYSVTCLSTSRSARFNFSSERRVGLDLRRRGALLGRIQPEWICCLLKPINRYPGIAQGFPNSHDISGLSHELAHRKQQYDSFLFFYFHKSLLNDFHSTSRSKSLYPMGMGILVSCCRLLGRSWAAMITATGTNTPGFFVWTLALTIVGWLASVGGAYLKFSGQNIPNPLARSLEDSWSAAALVLLGVAVLLTLAWAVSTVVVIYREHKASQTELGRIKGIITPLQFEGFELAAEIRDFALSFGDLDGPPPQAEAKFRKAVWEHLQEWIGSYPPELDAQMRLKMLHGFETRKFRERVEEYMHLVGESGSPIINAAGFTEHIFDRRSLCRLSADIEIVAISTNHFPSPRKRQG